MDAEWWAGFVLNVVSTFFAVGDLLPERGLQRLLEALLWLLILGLMLSLAVSVVAAGSIVDPLAGIWGMHSGAKLAGAAVLLALVVPVLGCGLATRHTRREAGLLSLFYVASVAVVLLDLRYPAITNPGPERLRVFAWITIHPSLAVHHMYATASLWATAVLTLLPLYAGGWASRKLARLPKARIATLVVALGGVVGGWALQLLGIR